jgi:hypothetical protein
MRNIDREVFKQVARDKNVWLLVRLTNAQSLKWAGKANYIPKPISCKAKTADEDNDVQYQIAGLVADPDPTIHRNKFRKEKLQKAVECWTEFSKKHLEPEYRQTGKGKDGYTLDIDKRSAHYGCVQRNGKYIHADYDLLDIVDATNPKSNDVIKSILDDAPHNYNPRFPEIQQTLNGRMDTPMVQHGGEAQFTYLYEQPIHVFFPKTGPNGEDYSHFDPIIWLNRVTAEHWYQEWFCGRQAAGQSPPRAPHRQYATDARVIRVDFKNKRRF